MKKNFVLALIIHKRKKNTIWQNDENKKESDKNPILKSRGRGARTPVNGFGDRRTTTVLFPYVFSGVTHQRRLL